MPSSRPFRIGTRKSALAQWQAGWVAKTLQTLGANVQLIPIVTEGDRRQDLQTEGWTSRGLFTREIQKALLEAKVDLAIHSLKDLPTQKVPGLVLAAVPVRGPVGDVLIARHQTPLHKMPPGAVLGTGSFRRRAQLLHARPDLQIESIRGNVDTRIRKLQSGQYDGLVLAEAGLTRLGIPTTEWTERLFPTVLLPAVGQGALGIEVRAEDTEVQEWVQQFDDPVSHAAVVAERAMLARLYGGCLAPVAAWARMESDRFVLTGRVLDSQGSQMLEVTQSVSIPGTLWVDSSQSTVPLEEAEQLGRFVADELIVQGADKLIQSARNS